MCSGMYTKSSCDINHFNSVWNGHKVFYLFNESLITRARNYLVDEFLRSPYTHLMFIDSDIHFNPNDVLTLVDKDIIGLTISKEVYLEKVTSSRCGLR